MHPRRAFSNGRVGHVSQKGLVTATRFVKGTPFSVVAPVADLLRRPDGGVDCQLLFGEDVTVLETQDGWAFARRGSDGYVGYLDAQLLGQPRGSTGRVSSLFSQFYSAPDMKSRARQTLTFGAAVDVQATEGDFARTPDGFVPRQHLRPLGTGDYVDVMERFLGIPYLWGGNSCFGMDCSGAVQLSLHAVGRPCPRDTDMQVAELGHLLAPEQSLKRGDLVFWKGHVGVMQDGRMMIHANAHDMTVASEPLVEAEARILAAGDGAITARKRL